MAWDRLKDDVIREPVQVANAEAVADRLNKAVVNDADLPDGSYYAAAGLTEDGIAGNIRREVKERFQKEPSDLDDKGAVILAYAYLRANVPFTLPFFDNGKEFLFADGRGLKTMVLSFGLWCKTALQAIDFRLDRSGVGLESESTMVWASVAPCFKFDRPFLIVVKKRGAERPFFVMWVDNAEFLCKP